MQKLVGLLLLGLFADSFKISRGSSGFPSHTDLFEKITEESLTLGSPYLSPIISVVRPLFAVFAVSEHCERFFFLPVGNQDIQYTVRNNFLISCYQKMSGSVEKPVLLTKVGHLGQLMGDSTDSGNSLEFRPSFLSKTQQPIFHQR